MFWFSFFISHHSPPFPRRGQTLQSKVRGGHPPIHQNNIFTTFVIMRSKKIHNRKYLEKFRKELRNNLTPAEAVLWSSLQRKQLDGRKFRRQHSIGNYITDFYCPSEKIAIELDGADHFTPEGSEADETRSSYLQELDIKVLRYENRDIYYNLEAVLEDIKTNFKNIK